MKFLIWQIFTLCAQSPHAGLFALPICECCKRQGAGICTLNLTNCEWRELIRENSCCAYLRCARLVITAIFLHVAKPERHARSLTHELRRPVGTMWRVQKEGNNAILYCWHGWKKNETTPKNKRRLCLHKGGRKTLASLLCMRRRRNDASK
jgi:hypothetical protein